MSTEERTRLGYEVEALTAFINHPGWKILGEDIRKQSEVSLMEMRNAKDAYALQRASLLYTAFTDLLRAPQVRLDSAASRLKMLQSLDKPKK